MSHIERAGADTRARGPHSGGLGATEQYGTLLARGHAGAWGWAASSDELFDGIDSIRTAPNVHQMGWVGHL